MTTSTALRRPRMTSVALLVLALVLTLVPVAPPAASANGGIEAEFVAAVNRERAAAGLPALSVASDLTSVARRHSVRMADQSNLHHNPNLGGDVSGWQKVGENVGRGPSVSSIHGAFMNSSGHRANILDREWTQIGVGVEVRGSTVWVTEVFRLPAGAAPKPPAEPKPSPSPSPSPSPTATSSGSSGGSSSSGGSGSSSGSSGGSSEPAPAASPSPTPSPTASAPPPPPEPEPEPEPEPHEVVDTPLPMDRVVVTLARLEVAEGEARLDEVLATD